MQMVGVTACATARFLCSRWATTNWRATGESKLRNKERQDNATNDDVSDDGVRGDRKGINEDSGARTCKGATPF